MTRKVFFINGYGEEPFIDETDGTIRDKEYLVLKEHGPIHQAFVFPIEGLDIYNEARQNYHRLRNEADGLMVRTLQNIRKGRII